MEVLILLNVVLVVWAATSITHRLERIEQRLEASTRGASGTQTWHKSQRTVPAAAQERAEKVSTVQPAARATTRASDTDLLARLDAEASVTDPLPAKRQQPHTMPHQENSDVLHADATVAFGRLWTWFIHEWPMKVGAILVLAALGWLVTYAFTNDIIGPVGRVTLTMLFGASVLAFGAVRVAKSLTQGGVLLFIGAITILMASIAGIDYGFVPTALALLVMLGVVAVVAVVGARHESVGLVTAAAVFAYAMPMLMSSSLTMNMTFLYFFFVTLGTIVTVVQLAWRWLLLLNIYTVLGYSLVMNGLYCFGDTALNLVFMVVFSAVFYLASIGTVLTARTVRAVDAVIAASVGFAYYVWTVMVVPEEAKVIFLALGAVAMAVGVLVVRRIPQASGVVFAYIGVAAGLVLAATAELFTGEALTVAVIMELGVVSVVLTKLYAGMNTEYVRKGVVLTGIFGAVIVVIMLSMGALLYAFGAENVHARMFDPRVYTNVLSQIFVLTAASAMTMVLAAAWLSWVLRGESRAQDNELADVRALRFFAVVAAVNVSMLMWLILHAFFAAAVATSISLVLYTIVGIVLYVSGGRTDYASYKAFGAAFLIAVVARLFLVDFWAMPVSAKVITFFVVGVLFISTAFMARRSE